LSNFALTPRANAEEAKGFLAFAMQQESSVDRASSAFDSTEQKETNAQHART